MKNSFDNGTLTLYPEGSIDTTNVAAVEEDMNAVIGQHQPTSLILNLKQLSYISSAGLRVVLKLRRRFGANIRAVEASPQVYEIFDITGFTEMLPVDKAYRELDVTGCEVIGEGANGKVYRIGTDTIVKVYKDADSLDEIKRERELARTAFVLGIPTAIPYDVVRVGDTYGSVFELLSAKSFAELLAEDESRVEFIAERTASIAKIIHSTIAPANLPSQQETVLSWVDIVEPYFTEEQYRKFRSMVEQLPEDGTMLHGDFHIKNIMQQGDDTLLIDMDTLCVGHPLYELAFMYNAYVGFGVVDRHVIENFLGVSADTARALWRRTLSLYLGTEDTARLDEVEDKAAIIGLLRVMRRCMRIGEDKTEEGRKLVAACHDRIADLLSRYDTLTFEER